MFAQHASGKAGGDKFAGIGQPGMAAVVFDGQVKIKVDLAADEMGSPGAEGLVVALALGRKGHLAGHGQPDRPDGLGHGKTEAALGDLVEFGAVGQQA